MPREAVGHCRPRRRNPRYILWFARRVASRGTHSPVVRRSSLSEWRVLTCQRGASLTAASAS